MANTKSGARRTTDRTAFVRKRISKARKRAKFTGFLYFLGVIALTALTCLSLVSLAVEASSGSFNASLGVMTIVGEFNAIKAREKSMEWIVVFAIYAALLLVLLINVIRALSKLGWLFKKKASRLYGVNRNAYAMDDLGNIFASSFVAVALFHFVYMVMPSVTVTFELFAIVALGVGVGVHLVCGLLGGKVSVFSTAGELFVEEKRTRGLLLPFVRNLFQMAAAGAIIYIFATAPLFEKLYEAFMAVGQNNVSKVAEGVMWQEIAVVAWAAVLPALCAVMLIIAFAMLKRAISSTEFDMEEFETPGKNKMIVCSVFMLLFVGAFYAVQAFVQKEATFAPEFLQIFYIVAGISAALILLEVIFRPHGKSARAIKREEDELDPVAFAERHICQPEEEKATLGVRDTSYASDLYFSNFEVKNRKVKKATKAQKKTAKKLGKRADEVTAQSYIYSKYQTAGAKAQEVMGAVHKFESKKSPKKAKKIKKLKRK